MISTFYLGTDSAENYGIIMTAPPDHVIAERDIERKEVPGRSGDVIIDNGRYKNITVKIQLCHSAGEWHLFPHRSYTRRAVFETWPSIPTLTQYIRPRQLPGSKDTGQLLR